MKNQEGFISIIVAVVITALLVGGSVYYWHEQVNTNNKKLIDDITNHAEFSISQLEEQIDNLQNRIEEDEQDKWLTYTNNDYGFEFSYLDNGAEINIQSFDIVGPVEPGPGEFWINATRNNFNNLLAKKDDFGPNNSCLENYSDYILDVLEHEISYCRIVKTDILYGLMYNVFDRQHLNLVFDDFVVHVYVDGVENREILYSIIENFKFIDDMSTWHTYTNDNWNFSFQYPGDWQILSDSGARMSVGVAPGDNPFMALRINPDGFGPHFPDKSYTLGRVDGHLIVTNEETHDITANNNDGYYQIIASDDDSSVSPYFWMSFTDKTTDRDAWEATVKKIIESLVLLD